jgi:hypothetical protein
MTMEFLWPPCVVVFPGQHLGASVACSLHPGDDQCCSLCDHCESNQTHALWNIMPSEQFVLWSRRFNPVHGIHFTQKIGCCMPVVSKILYPMLLLQNAPSPTGYFSLQYLTKLTKDMDLWWGTMMKIMPLALTKTQTKSLSPSGDFALPQKSVHPCVSQLLAGQTCLGEHDSEKTHLLLSLCHSVSPSHNCSLRCLFISSLPLFLSDYISAPLKNIALFSLSFYTTSLDSHSFLQM